MNSLKYLFKYRISLPLLRRLNGGTAWSFMEDKLFPQLRRVELRIEYKSIDKQRSA
jgi:hypothetical protein